MQMHEPSRRDLGYGLWCLPEMERTQFAKILSDEGWGHTWEVGEVAGLGHRKDFGWYLS